MDYLRTLGSAAVSSIVQKSGLNLPFTLGEKVLSFEGKSIWSLHDGIKRDDGTPVSVFVFNVTASNRNFLPFARNAVRKLRTTRHPEVLKFLDAIESDSVIYIMTERVQPLGKVMQAWTSKGSREREDWLTWGLHRITVALKFINHSLSATHGIIRVDSIFISPSGEWKLGGFELLSKPDDEAPVLYNMGGLYPNNNDYASPEVRKNGWSVLKDHHPAVADAYALGILIHCLFNPSLPLPPTVQPPHPPPAPSSRGSIPSSMFPSFKKLLNPNPKTRISPEIFLSDGTAESGDGAGFFAKNRLVQVCVGLDEFNFSDEGKKASLLRILKESSSSFPPEFISHRVVPSLVSAIEFGGASASGIVPLVLQFGTNVAPEDYPTVVLAPILKLYASPDRATRVVLLEHLSQYAERLDKKAVNDKIWPNLRTGFSDTVPVIRESTVKAIGTLFPKFSERILNNELLRHLAQMQMDTEPSIRTNTCILIGRIGPSLGYNTKKKILVPAFNRALKDVFVHARVAALMAYMATIDCFDVDDMANRVIPSISGSLLDKEKPVRDQAFKTLDIFVKKIESHAATMPETAAEENGQPIVVSPTAFGGQGALVNTAAGAASALAGWAMSSMNKKLIPGDMQSATAALERPISAPPPLSGLTNGRSLTTSPLGINGLNSTLSSPGISTISDSRSKSMQLGGVKPSSSIFAADLATQLTREAESDAGNAWGNDDLMDVNADEDDWNAFESAPAPGPSRSTALLAPKPVIAATNVNVADDDAWGDMDESSSANAVANAFEIDSRLTYPTLAPHTRTSNSISRAKSPPTRGSTPGLPDRSGAATPTTPSIPTPGLNTMTKEEKAAEMARRKEERKQRIAKLKEQKVSGTKT